MSDGRCFWLDEMRLRATTSSNDADDPAGGTRRDRLPAARRTRHRHRQQDSGLRAPGSGRRYGGSECAAGVGSGSARLSTMCRDSLRPRSLPRESHLKQPAQTTGTGRGGVEDRRESFDRSRLDRRRRRLPAHEERETRTSPRTEKIVSHKGTKQSHEGTKKLWENFVPSWLCFVPLCETLLYCLLLKSLIVPLIRSASAALGSSFRYFSNSSAACWFLCTLM